MLQIEGLSAGYGIDVLHDVSVHLDAGELVTVVGSNGAGKSTLLRTISGLVKPTAGHVRFGDGSARPNRPDAIAAWGVAHLPEGKRLFLELSIEDNLRLGAWRQRRRGRQVDKDLASVYERFPILAERRAMPASTLSGGEQQMLAISMAVIARPRVLLLDEPSLGLAPAIVDDVFGYIRELSEQGMTILLAEQFARRALEFAHRGYVLSLGRVVVNGSPEELMSNPDVSQAYLGV